MRCHILQHSTAHLEKYGLLTANGLSFIVKLLKTNVTDILHMQNVSNTNKTLYIGKYGPNTPFILLMKINAKTEQKHHTE